MPDLRKMVYGVIVCGTHFCDHSRFMPDLREKVFSISCWGAVRVGTGLLEGVGAGAANARRISSVVALRTNNSSFTIHNLRQREKDRKKKERERENEKAKKRGGMRLVL